MIREDLSASDVESFADGMPEMAKRREIYQSFPTLFPDEFLTKARSAIERLSRGESGAFGGKECEGA